MARPIPRAAPVMIPALPLISSFSSRIAFERSGAGRRPPSSTRLFTIMVSFRSCVDCPCLVMRCDVPVDSRNLRLAPGSFARSDDLFLCQLRDGLRVVPQLPQDLLGVLAQGRGHHPNGRGLLVVAHGVRQEAHLPGFGMIEGHDGAVCLQLEIVLYVAVVVDRRVPYPGLVKDPVPVLGAFAF